ncbi:unnamed protein product [Trypanosoma congolense IL3000]|uniref:WGS project CAEQ00000000 data, annotated contig 318 n=1 Tax=Trypanosoma congolense (strain IL3000) TaxID=1068625 RepID=F9WEV8_TRYCI|nr:unnamed protein product [Trypanosoma congolense IL3000]
MYPASCHTQSVHRCVANPPYSPWSAWTTQFFQHAIPAPHTARHTKACAHTQRASKCFGNATLFTTVPPTLSWSLCPTPREENGGPSNRKRLLTMIGGCLNCTSRAAWDKERLRHQEPLLLRPKTAAPLPLGVQPFSRLSTHCDMLLHFIHTNTTLLLSTVDSLASSSFPIQRAKETTPVLYGAC